MRPDVEIDASSARRLHLPGNAQELAHEFERTPVAVLHTEVSEGGESAGDYDVRIHHFPIQVGATVAPILELR
jgi:hypothetical protein